MGRCYPVDLGTSVTGITTIDNNIPKICIMLNTTWLRTALAIILGEIALILLTTVAQEVLFDGIRYHTSTWSVLIFGGLATFLAAVTAGWIARVVARKYRSVVPAVISLIILVETSYLIIKQVSGDPLWFDILAGLSLVIGIWLGYYSIKQNTSPQSIPEG